MKAILDILYIIRPFNILIAILSVFFVINMLTVLDICIYISISSVIGFYMSGAYILNDFLDIKIDKINKPSRTLVKYDINDKILIIIIFTLFFIGSLIAYTLPDISIYIAVYITLPAIVLYELIFKKIPLIGNIIISLLVGLIFVYTEAATTESITLTYPIMILAFLLNLIREIIKDIEDRHGDSTYNFKTLPIAIGLPNTIFILRALSVLFFIISYFLLYDILSIYFLPLIFFTIHIPLLYINLGLKDNISSEECTKFSKMLKLMIFVGVLIILFLS